MKLAESHAEPECIRDSHGELPYLFGLIYRDAGDGGSAVAGA